MMQCETCKKTQFEAALYRNGPKGKIVPWRCIEHVDPRYHPHPDVQAISELISCKPKA